MLLTLGLIACLIACGAGQSGGRSSEGGSKSAGLTCGAGRSGSGSGNAPSGPAPAVAGKLLETGETTLDLVNGGRRTSIACAPGDTSYFEYPAFAADGSRIAYVLATTPTAQGQDWGNDLYSAGLDGSNAKLVYRHDAPGALADFLSWTPDDEGLIFGYSRALYDSQGHYTRSINRIDRLDLATGALSTLIENASQPTLAWDGRQMVYVALAQDGQQTLMIANLDGSSTRTLALNNAGFQTIFAPELSPDGQRIVFAAIGGPSAGSVAPVGSRGLGPGQSVLAMLGRLAASRLQPASAQADGTPYQIWVASLDGTNLHVISGLREDVPFTLWSADGKSLLILGSAALYTAGSDATSLKKIDYGVPHGEIAWYQR